MEGPPAQKDYVMSSNQYMSEHRPFDWQYSPARLDDLYPNDWILFRGPYVVISLHPALGLACFLVGWWIGASPSWMLLTLFLYGCTLR